MKIAKSLQLITLSLSLVTLSASANTPQNSMYAEVGGNALAYSLNYERNLAEDWAVRLGLGSFRIHKHDITIAPVMINKLWGNEHSCHKFETGLGAILVGSKKLSQANDHFGKSTNVAGTATLGYRFAPKTEGILFRAGFTPIITDKYILPWAGVSVGYAF